MRGIAVQSKSDSGPHGKQNNLHAARIPPLLSRPVAAPFRPVIRRKASCACGGGCPTCSDDLLLKNIQPKLTVSTPGDRHEQEADDVADRVMRMPDESPVLSSSFSLQRDNKLNLDLKTDSSSDVGQVGTGFTSRLGAGQPLDTGSRQYFEPRFGQSFDNVRIHNGPDAAAAAATVKARAFTLGNDIVFGAGEHHPESQHGKRLLAHELTPRTAATSFATNDPPRRRSGCAPDAGTTRSDHGDIQPAAVRG
jgi:Domain of unknown function (DUF4157)